MTAHTVDVTNATFEEEVVEASKSTPVIVDFWAPWCGPCKMLKPILEKLADEYAGKFKLAKINSDENQDIAAAYGVRSIPDVMAFRNGTPVAHFLGAVPESQVRAFIDKLIPTPSGLEQSRAATLCAAGDLPQAVEALQNAVRLDPGNVPARLDLAAVLIEAEATLATVAPGSDWDQRLAALRAAIAFARSVAAGGSEAQWQARLAANAGDHAARFALASLHAGARRYKEALEELLEIVRRDRTWMDGEARKQILAIFNLAADQSDLVSEYRRKLASTLN